jgi:uncharacterized membrane protein YgcG
VKNLLLKLELRRNGATAADADTMARIADSIGRDVPGLSNDAKQRIADEIGFSAKKSFVTAPRLVFASFAVLFIALVVLAQSAKPGQILYGLKRGSDQVRVIVQPGFKQTDLQERRAAEQINIGDDTKTPRTSGSTKSDDKDATGSVQKRLDDLKRSTSGSSNQGESQKSGSSNSGSGSSGGSHGGSGSDDSGGGRD